MKINDFVNSDHISSELSAYIVEHFNPLYATTVRLVQLPHGQRIVETIVNQGYIPPPLILRLNHKPHLLLP